MPQFDMKARQTESPIRHESAENGKATKTDEQKHARVSMVHPRLFSPKSVDPFAKHEDINLFAEKRDQSGSRLRLAPGKKSFAVGNTQSIGISEEERLRSSELFIGVSENSTELPKKETLVLSFDAVKDMN